MASKLWKKSAFTLMSIADAASWYCVLVLVILMLQSYMRETSQASYDPYEIIRGNQILERPCDEIYVVQEGETLHTISDNCSVLVLSLRMVAFGKKLKENQIEEWREYYIDYKFLKKKVNRYTQQIDVGAENQLYVLKDFSRMLDCQEKSMMLFYSNQMVSKIPELREAYRVVGHDLLKLLFFVEMNATGLRKILKKFDKRFGYRFTDYYVKTRANHPYSQLQQVFKHVGIEAVVGAISRNLADLQDHEGNYISIYDQPSLSHPDPIIDSIRAAVNKLSNSTNFLEYLGKHAFIIQEELPTSSEESFIEQNYHFMSLLLNLCPDALKLDSFVCFTLLINEVQQYFRLGSARAVNRRYISDCVPHKLRMQASASFVSASALGMACGPALACLLQTNFKIYKLTFNEDTLPGWVMAFLWLAYLLWLWISFREPSHETKELVPQQTNSGLFVNDGAVESGSTQPLLLKSEAENQDEATYQELEDGDEDSEGSHEPVTSIVSAYRLLTPSVKVQLFIYFMLKYAMEILLAESSVITGYYFIWSTSSVAIFLACLGLTVLPVNVLVGSYISNIFEERQVLLASEIMVCIGILLSFNVLIPYSVPQYVGSALVTFVSAEVLEGVNLSLLSRVMSSRLSRGTYNGGLLSTEAGTLARVIADGTITLSGYLSESRLLNATLLPSLFICISSIVATCLTYNSLY
ncbi:hypothetical protein GH714_019658 [Hevea brasiliensis]|uniref:SPX domain-containing protein n=1 Tax=Hevea brasiliensis TaxID=3981 RepID=A0A6A6MF50_HEVBR|nr:hypothetical protein GH714_019658 [Hevea brasiliensis]